MADTLPYLASPGSIKTCLDKIKAAATPDRVTQDFVTTKLQIKGGTGAALIPYLKKIGFVASDGSPTDTYKQFRNHATAGAAAAAAVKTGYKALGQVNEYFYDLNDKDLLALIVQITGAEEGNQVAKLTLSTLKTLKAFANFDAKVGETAKDPKATDESKGSGRQPDLSKSSDGRRQGLSLSYTINLNLPATTDQAVFNAIFRSLKEHLITDNE
ncbi:DUF5343 domain-containing protein [Rudaea sp.]|uniref:DUF5343 domain-containing protein n=1 Tax=Rudaea sp. TaxID=2136325 RepID=UPI0032201B2C